MNIEYIKNVVAPQRKKEAEQGKHRCTRNAIFFIYDLVENFFEGHPWNTYTGFLNRKQKGITLGYLVDGEEGRKFSETPQEEEVEEVTRFFTDKFVALFFTEEAAIEYLERQSHNLSSEAYIYVEYAGYSNTHMDEILRIPE